jgi:hypothetical protein
VPEIVRRGITDGYLYNLVHESAEGRVGDEKREFGTITPLEIPQSWMR